MLIFTYLEKVHYERLFELFVQISAKQNLTCSSYHPPFSHLIVQTLEHGGIGIQMLWGTSKRIETCKKKKILFLLNEKSNTLILLTILILTTNHLTLLNY